MITIFVIFSVIVVLVETSGIFSPAYKYSLLFLVFLFLFEQYRKIRSYILNEVHLENELKTTGEIVHTLLTTTNLNVLLARIIDNLAELKKFDTNYIYVISGDNFLNCIATKGVVSSKGISKFSSVLSDSCFIINNVIKTKKYNIVRQKDKELDCQLCNKFRLTEFIVLPLIVHDKVIGLIISGNKAQKISVSKKELDVLETISNQAAIALHNAQLYSKIQELSITDELTGLYNYRFFQHKIREQIELVKRYGHTLSLVIVDIDFFKNYNDKNGHLAGDRCLKQVTEIILQNIRKTDWASRYGGEEFALILPATDKFGSYKVIENLRTKIENFPFEHSDRQPSGKLTISAGISNYPQDTEEVRELIDLADKTLYKAKDSGRNKVLVYASDFSLI